MLVSNTSYDVEYETGFNSLTTEKDGLQSQLTERDTQLKDLKGKVKDSDELTAEIMTCLSNLFTTQQD
ncbi:phage scaffolding protein [Limosilactobacillus fermentum]